MRAAMGKPCSRGIKATIPAHAKARMIEKTEGPEPIGLHVEPSEGKYPYVK